MELRQAGREALASLWDANAAGWISSISNRDISPAAAAFLPDLAGQDVLDLGCGEGSFSRYLATRGARVTGLDISNNLIDRARSLEAEKPQGICYHVGSFQGLDAFADASFDAAIAIMSFMCAPDFLKTAREAFRVLRSAGTLHFLVPHPCFTTAGTFWARDPHRSVVGRLVRDYWRTQPFYHEASTKNLRRLIFPHRLEDYVNGLANAGFRITRMIEPRLPKEDGAAAPRRRHDPTVPLLLQVAAAKA